MMIPSECRKHPARGVKDIPNQSTIVMVTTCAKNRQLNIANAEVHRILDELWHEATGWRVGTYMIMPDHIHYFVARGSMDISLER